MALPACDPERSTGEVPQGADDRNSLTFRHTDCCLLRVRPTALLALCCLGVSLVLGDACAHRRYTITVTETAPRSAPRPDQAVRPSNPDKDPLRPPTSRIVPRSTLELSSESQVATSGVEPPASRTEWAAGREGRSTASIGKSEASQSVGSTAVRTQSDRHAPDRPRSSTMPWLILIAAAAVLAFAVRRILLTRRHPA